MGLKIYNSLTNKLEEFIPINGKKVNMYVCGPTVYNYIHIGNARPVIFYDMLRRYLEFIGYDVTYASNITDVDDKIINKAVESGKTEKEIATFFEEKFFEAVEMVGSKKPDLIPHATDYIDEMIDFINQLIESGYAYEADGDVYFRVSKINDYGILSNQVSEDLESGARISVNDKKESPLDFTLWKKTETGIKWESPFGPGRPGWHTECVVMNHKLFGEMIDIHGGGMDLKFPHHENEIAQSMALHDNAIANYWIHNARIDLKGEKMSKSLGNVIWLKDVLKAYPYQAYRLFILANHYRQSVSYSDELMNSMSNEWTKLRKAYVSLYRNLELKDVDMTKAADPIDMDPFIKEMAYDFNTANALTVIYEHIKTINKSLRDPKIETDVLARQYYALRDMYEVFGINVDIKPLTLEEKQLVLDWQNARKEKNFELADKYRAQITESGIEL